MPFTPSPRLRGDRVQNAGRGEPVDVWIYSAFPKDNWVAHKPGDWTHAEHPGTAIQMGEELFEILTMQETSEPGYVVRYGLKRWEPKHAIRMMIPYTPQTQAQSAADYLDERHKQDLRARILWLIPLAGLAPDPVQREWERKTALNMAVISAVSAITVILLFMTLSRRPPAKEGCALLCHLLPRLRVFCPAAMDCFYGEAARNTPPDASLHSLGGGGAPGKRPA